MVVRLIAPIACRAAPQFDVVDVNGNTTAKLGTFKNHCCELPAIYFEFTGSSCDAVQYLARGQLEGETNASKVAGD